MSTTPHRAIIPGSERQPLHGAQAVGAVPADERFEVTVRVRRKAPLQSPTAVGFQADQKPGQRRYLNRDAYSAAHGADPANLAKVEAFAKTHGLVVVKPTPLGGVCFCLVVPLILRPRSGRRSPHLNMMAVRIGGGREP